MINVFVALTQELPTKEEEDTKSIQSVGKQKLKRGRAAKSKMKKPSKYEIFFQHVLAFLYCGSDSAVSHLTSSSFLGCAVLL